MSNAYLLDTSALIDDPDIIFHFEEKDLVVISTVTIGELDGLKESKRKNVSSQARKVIGYLDRYRVIGNLVEGVELENGSILMVVPPLKEHPIYDEYGKIPDTQIMTSGLQIAKDLDIQVLSTDIDFRVIASVVGLGVFEYVSKEQAILADNYLGYIEIENDVLSNSLQVNGALHISKIPESYGELYQNQYIRFVSPDPKQQVIGIIKGEYVVLPKGKYRNKAGRFETKNFGQKILADALTDKDITVVTVEGVAGTGKTIEALAFSLKQVDDNDYTKVICYRAIAPLDDGLGFLPGTEQEKLAPWSQPIFDNLEVLGRNDFLENGEPDGAIEINALTYARGRSLPNVIIIVDEAQNLTRLQAKTMATRLGEGAKIIFLYDPEQIDHKYLDKYNNGGRHVSTRLRGQEIHAHVTLTETVRSKTAAICAKLL